MATFFSADAVAPEWLQAVDDGLDQHNGAVRALQDVRALHVVACGADGQVIGGAVGRSWGRCCELQQLWVADAHRHSGIGTELMRRFEADAAQRQCALIYLDTFSFQAPQFYGKCGFTVLLETRGYTEGIVRFTMQKTLPGC